MEERSKGISLRKKRSVRPKVTARQISAPLPSLLERPRLTQQNSSTLSVPRERLHGDGNTADYVKRRYSTRIIQTKDSDAPAVPTFPSKFSQSPAQNGAIGGENVAVDTGALQNPELQPEQYTAQLLANATEHDIHEYQRELGQIKSRTATELQHNVYQNRNQFIKISQEAEKLKGEMRALRNLMSDLTSTLSQTNAALGINTNKTSAARKFANRSSVANLEALWSSHLQELWRRVEGSQRYLPAIAGRHVTHESGHWVELNTATWKQRRRVHLILLNDHLLVAVEKKRVNAPPQIAENQTVKPNTSQTQLVAEHCWPLQDVEIADLSGLGIKDKSTRPSTSNAMNVRVASEGFTYAVSGVDGSEKSYFLAKFRKAVAELQKFLQVDVDDIPESYSRERLPTLRYATGNSMANSTSGIIDSNRASMLVEHEGKQQPFRWVEAQVDELDIEIALQRFNEAVGRVETLRNLAMSNKGNPMLQDIVNGKVRERAARLAKTLTRQLIDTHSFMTATQQNVAWLIKLGFEGQSSQAYLSARSDALRARLCQCADQGDLHQYLYQVSFIYFTIIRNTVSIYQNCFAPVLASACIKWAKEHVDEFNVILSQQMNRLERGGEDWRYCLDRARAHAAMLADVGIDFSSLIGKGLDGNA